MLRIVHGGGRRNLCAAPSDGGCAEAQSAFPRQAEKLTASGDWVVIVASSTICGGDTGEGQTNLLRCITGSSIHIRSKASCLDLLCIEKLEAKYI